MQFWLALLTFLYVDFLDTTGTLFSMANFLNNFIPGAPVSAKDPCAALGMGRRNSRLSLVLFADWSEQIVIPLKCNQVSRIPLCQFSASGCTNRMERERSRP